MPEIQIRLAISTDLSSLSVIDHSTKSDYVWQMESLAEPEQLGVNFRKVRLPRSVSVEYPRRPGTLSEMWKSHAGILVAEHEGAVIGYCTIDEPADGQVAWVKDVVVTENLRRQGIGASLLLAAQDWAQQRRLRRMMLETTAKNNPGISLALKLGYIYCGYNDSYFTSHDIAFFFTRMLKK